MPALTSLLIGGLVLGAAGAVTSTVASANAASASKDIAQQQQQQNVLRQQQMELDAQRQQREQIRRAQIAHATAGANATAQGANLGSGLQGGYSQISGDAGRGILGVNQNLDLGRQNFALDTQISSDRVSLASAQGTSAFGSGLTSLGSSIFSFAAASNRMSQGFNTSRYSGGGFEGSGSKPTPGVYY